MKFCRDIDHDSHIFSINFQIRRQKGNVRMSENRKSVLCKYVKVHDIATIFQSYCDLEARDT